jgi:hypothetical protein
LDWRKRTGESFWPCPGLNVVSVVDFIEAANSTLHDHQNERLSIIQGTPGFAEHIVNDFDYSFRKGA